MSVMPQTWQIIVFDFKNKTDGLKKCFGMKQCFRNYYSKKNNFKMMREENKKSIRKLSGLRHRYVINGFIEKYYKFGSYAPRARQ